MASACDLSGPNTAMGSNESEHLPSHIDAASRPSPARAWYTVLVLMLAYVISMMDRIILTLLVTPIEASLRITNTQFGVLTGFAFALFYSVAGIPIARLADRYSRRAVIAIGLLAWSVMTALSGFATNYGELFAARMGVGVGEASLSPAAVSMISDSFSKRNISRALAVFTIGGTLGSGLAYLAGGAVVRLGPALQGLGLPMLSERNGWQIVFVVVAIPGILVALLMATVPEPLRRRKTDSRGQENGRAIGIIEHLRRNRAAYGLYFLGYACFQAVFYGFISWLPLLLTRRIGISLGEAGTALGIVVVLVGPIGMIAGGWCADYIGAGKRMDSQVLVAATGCAGLGIFSIVMPLSSGLHTVMVLLGLFYFFSSMVSGVGYAGVQAITPPHLYAQTTAIFFLVINLLGISIGPVLIALLTDYAFRAPQAIAASLALVGGTFSALAVLSFALSMSAFRRSVRPCVV